MSYQNYNHRFLKIVNKFHLLIFQHLEVNDILKLSEVEKKLNDEIGNCAHCMTQVLLHVNLDTFTRTRDLNCIIHSKRNYRNLRISCLHDDDLSFISTKIIENHSNTIVNLEVYGMKIKDDVDLIVVPKLMFLKISSVNSKAMEFLLNLSKLYQKLIIQDISWVIDDHKISSLIMNFNSVRLLNVQINSLTNIDFLFNNCIDFTLEYDQMNEFSSLCEIFQNALNCTELTIRGKDKSFLETKTLKFMVHRFKGGARSLSPEMFERKSSKEKSKFLIDEIASGVKRRKINRIDRNSNFEETKFAITLEIDEINFSMLEKFGRILTNLNTLKIFDITERKKIEIFQCFKNLQLITIEKLDEIQSEFFYARSEFEIKPTRDPLLFFKPEIRSLILQHFTFDDFLQSSEVSSKWNNIISENTDHNSKIIFKINHSDFKEKSNNVQRLNLPNSKTVYNEIMKSKKFIKNFDISCNFDIKVVLNFQNLIHNFSQFLVELQFSEVKMKSQQIIHYLIFPRLKILKLKSVDENFCKMIFTNLSTLEILKLQYLNFHRRFRARIRNQKNLKKIYLRDCNFSAFEAESEEFEFKFLEFIEISFYEANAWKSKTIFFGISQFLFSSKFENVKNLKVCGIRGENLSKLIKRFKNLENLELNGFWGSDLIDMDIIQQKLNLYVPNFYHVDEFPWRKKFRGLQTIFASSIESKIETSQVDKNFKKILRGSALKMIKNDLYKVSNVSIDPLNKLPEHVHDLIFQHLNGKDALNSLEVSQSWKNFLINARTLMSKIELNLPEVMSSTNQKIMKENVRKFQTVYCHGLKFNFIVNFSYFVKKITIILKYDETYEKKLNFVNLEVLILKSENQGFNNLGSILKVFEDCKKLKNLVIKADITDDCLDRVCNILSHNPNLTEIHLENCLVYKELFYENINHNFKFKLRKFVFGIPSSDTIYNTKYEENLIEFLKAHKETLEEIYLSHSSANIVNEVFPNFKNLKTFYGTYFIGFNAIICLESFSITKFIILLTDPEGCHFFITRLPKVEFLYIYGIDLEILRDVCFHLAFLKVLAFTNDRSNCIREYDSIVAENVYVNRNLKFKKVDKVRFENLNFERVFGGYEGEF